MYDVSDIIRSDPVWQSHGARPFDVLEIDRHPDAARIWATIGALRRQCEDEAERAEEMRRDKEARESAKEAREVAVLDLASARLTIDFEGVAGGDYTVTVGHTDAPDDMRDALDNICDYFNDALEEVLQTIEGSR